MVDDLTHWTREGTFRLKLVTLAASYFVEPWLNDTRLGTYGYPIYRRRKHLKRRTR